MTSKKSQLMSKGLVMVVNATTTNYNRFMDRVILHCDMNAFFASVELLEHPELRELPVAVCGDPESRHGIVLAKNEIAKSFGISTAETIYSARRKCPSLKTLKAHHWKYHDYSKKINDIYYRFTDMLEPFSVDESWLDISGSIGLFGDGREVADKIRQMVKKELGLTLSVGVSFNKIFAKMGSDYKKPDATTVISRDNFKDILWPLPAGAFFGVGRATAAKLRERGINTIGDLALYDRNILLSAFGKMGGVIHDHANGLDSSPVSQAFERRSIKSVGNGITFRRDISGEDDICIGVTALADSVAGRLRKYGLRCGGVKVDIKDPHFKVVSKQKKLFNATNSTEDIIHAALDIIREFWGFQKPIRLITITGVNLTDDEAEQLSFLGALSRQDMWHDDVVNLQSFDLRDVRDGGIIDYTVDEIRRKYGAGAIVYANLLNNDIGIELDEMADEGDATTSL